MSVGSDLLRQLQDHVEDFGFGILGQLSDEIDRLDEIETKYKALLQSDGDGDDRQLGKAASSVRR